MSVTHTGKAAPRRSHSLRHGGRRPPPPAGRPKPALRAVPHEAAPGALQATELARHLIAAREDERGHLARELHDELGSLLTLARLDAARINSRLRGAAPEALERLDHLVETLDAMTALKRRVIEDLRPPALTHLGLATTLGVLAREFAAQSGITVHCALDPVRLQPNAELVLYRLVQEAITNIAKHAKARQVWIRLGLTLARVEASVRDDGIGFDPGSSQRSAFGLVSMRCRVEAEGGSLLLNASPGHGTLVRVLLPASVLVAGS